MADSNSKKLRIFLVSCDLNQDLDYLSKNDPFIEMDYHGQKWRSSTKDNAGRHAEWSSDEFFDIAYDSLSSTVFFNCWDADWLDKKSLHGTGKFSVQ